VAVAHVFQIGPAPRAARFVHREKRVLPARDRFRNRNLYRPVDYFDYDYDEDYEKDYEKDPAPTPNRNPNRNLDRPFGYSIKITMKITIKIRRRLVIVISIGRSIVSMTITIKIPGSS